MRLGVGCPAVTLIGSWRVLFGCRFATWLMYTPECRTHPSLLIVAWLQALETTIFCIVVRGSSNNECFAHRLRHTSSRRVGNALSFIDGHPFLVEYIVFYLVYTSQLRVAFFTWCPPRQINNDGTSDFCKEA